MEFKTLVGDIILRPEICNCVATECPPSTRAATAMSPSMSVIGSRALIAFPLGCVRRRPYSSPSCWSLGCSPIPLVWLIGSRSVSAGCSRGSVRGSLACSNRVRRRNRPGRREMMIHRDRPPLSPKAGSLEIRERKVRNKPNDLPLGNVLPTTTHDSNVILRAYCVPSSSGL